MGFLRRAAALILSSFIFSIPSVWAQTDDASSPLLPVFMIDLGGQEMTEHSKLSGTLTVVTRHDGSHQDLASRRASMQSQVTIEVHGDSSTSLPKKSYDVELVTAQGRDRKLPLLGLPPGSDWILHGCGRDESCLRNALIYTLVRQSGRYAPRTRFIEVFINGAYQGLYVLVEQVRRDTGRVNLPEAAETSSDGDISGSYLFRMDLGLGTPGDVVPRDWVSDASALVYSYHYPRYDEITPEQRRYLTSHIAQFEAMMSTSGWNDGRDGYRAWIDVPSWVDFALVQELSVNVDAYFKSVYLQKWPDAVGGKIALGPVWDFDITLGVADFRGGRAVDQWVHTMNRFGTHKVAYQPPGDVPFVPAYWERLWMDPAFRNDLQCRWRQLRRGPLLVSHVNALIEKWMAQLAPAQARDAALWHGNDPKVFVSEVEYLKEILGKRLAWMDANLPGLCAA